MPSTPATLSELCDAIVDCEHKTAPTAPVGVPSIRTTNIKNGRIDFDNANRVTESTYAEWTQRMEPVPGDLILAREAPVGEVGLIPPGQRACLGQRTVLIRPNPEVLHPRYLLYLLLTPEMRHEMDVRASGSTVAHLNMSDIRGLELPPLPRIDDQRAIAGVLGALDDKIEQNRRTARALERLARAIFRAWFVDFEPVKAKAAGAASFPSMPQAAFDALPTRLVDSAIGPVPEGWEVGTLGDVARQVRDGVKPSEIDPATPYIGLEHMPRRSITLAEWEHAGKVTSGKSRFATGQILFGKLRPYFHKVGVAPIDGVCSTDIVVVEPKARDWFGLVLGHVSSDDFVAHTTACSTGTKMPRTNWGDMASYPVALPPIDLAGAFTKTVAPMAELLRQSVFESQRLAELRDLLLPKLLSGEVRVSQAGAVV